MKNKIQVIYCFMFLAFLSCTSKDIVIENFDSDTYGNWTVEGEAFGSVPSKGALMGQQDVVGFEGKGLANSYNGGDNSRGVLISPEFTVERNYINFLLGGGTNPDTYIELIVDGKSVYITRSIFESETLQQMTWDVKDCKGKKAVIKIVDNQRGDWGHILVDEIVMSDKEKSKYIIDYQMPFDITQKYLLVPIQSDAPESIVVLEANGVKSPKMHIRLAQNKVDYWVPIDVENYKGQQVILEFPYVNKTDIGYPQIKQSDSFIFDYNVKYRPIYHFTPQYGWMNDPNGMVYLDGEYHLFYQYNPYGSKWGNMHWGHAVTKDLKKWEHLSAAIAPDSLGTIFSGSAVIDKNNTAGFGKYAMIAIYTSAGEEQSQSIAYSLDKGRTFTKYGHNPVLTDPNIADFRDPKVMWHESIQKWIMSLATSQTISFYRSENLKEWEKLSEFGDGIGDHGGVWECPDLFPLSYNGQTKWVLLVSINPGGPNGGSATQYFIGDFNGKTFKADNLPYPLWIDYGRDNYAGVTWDNVPKNDGRRLFIGWMNNWDYANSVPILNFKSANTVPRELKLVNNGKHVVLNNFPIMEMNDLRNETNTVGNINVDKTHTIDKLLSDNSGAYEIEMTLKPLSTNNFGFKLLNSKGESLSFTFDLANEIFIVDRTKSGLVDFSTSFASQNKAPIVKKDNYKIRLLMDKASSECFINDGELVSTDLVYPTEPYNSLVFDGQLSVDNLVIYKLK